jgi:hypothetical protein
MRADLGRLIRDVSLVTLALAIALGWAVLDLTRGIASFVDHLLLHVPAHQDNAIAFAYSPGGGALTWVVHQHVITLDGMLTGAIEVGAVLLAATLIARRRFSESS